MTDRIEADYRADTVQAVAEALAEFNACGHCGGECDACQGEAKVAIAAARPAIEREAKVAALREAADALHDPTCLGCSGDDEMVVVARWLRDRAYRIEADQ